MIRVVGNLSGGTGSWAAVRKYLDETDPSTYTLTLLFADTLTEDQDTYRFMIAAAANLLGVTLPTGLLPEINDFPPWHGDGFDRSPYKRYVLALRRRVKQVMPGLVWLDHKAEDIWDVFLRKRFLGSSRMDPCSEVLKRKALDRWLEKNTDPATTVSIVGLGPQEPERFYGNPKFGTRGLRLRKLDDGYTVVAPLLEEPSPWWPHRVEAELAKAGLWVQRLYVLGFSHANCSGGCCKAGMGQWKLMLKVFPERYTYCERQEAFIRQVYSIRQTMLTDRRGAGPRRPLSLIQLRTRDLTPAEQVEGAGCRCALGDDPELLPA